MAITLEYCVSCGYERRATMLADHLRAAFQTDVTLEKGSGGAFELAVDGRLVFSKKALGRFPTDDEAVAAVEQAAPRA